VGPPQELPEGNSREVVEGNSGQARKVIQDQCAEGLVTKLVPIRTMIRGRAEGQEEKNWYSAGEVAFGAVV